MDQSVATPASEPLVYRPEDLPEVLGVGLSSVYRALRLGQIPSRRIGRRYVVGRAQLEKWLEDQS